jgi:hypothetical protein
MSYPDNCIKGITNKTFLLEDGTLRQDLFYFHMNDLREDGWIEQSINWEDDKDAVEFTLSQKRSDGEIHFKAGLAIIPIQEVDRLNRRPTIKGKISYERNPKDDNPYHGNLLLRADTITATRNAIGAGLMLAVQNIMVRS